MRRVPFPPAAVAGLALVFFVGLGVRGCSPALPADVSSYTVVSVAPGPNFEARARSAFLNALPGTIIELPAGTWPLQASLTLDTSHVVVRGAGIDQTVLDFTGQVSGAQGILARGDHFSVQDLTIVNPAGDGVKTEFVKGATFERVKVEWTDPDPRTHGDYGVYPAQNEDVLIDGVVILGSRDAGIYVGQSRNVIVRNSYAEGNVLGIEIENSTDCDVYNNTATGNTGGIAVFNLDLPVLGDTVRVFDNVVTDNNVKNFAAGGILASVPGGTGIIVIAGKDVEIFDNVITGNDTVNLFVSSFDIAVRLGADSGIFRNPAYDPYAEGIYIHDNTLSGGGGNAGIDALGAVISVITDVPVPDIVVAGFVDQAKLPAPFDPTLVPLSQQVAPHLKICVQNNGTASFFDMNGFQFGQITDRNQLRDPSTHDCALPALPAVVLPPTPPVPQTEPQPSPEEVAALCGAAGQGVNWDAAWLVNCPTLAGYRLFDGDPRGNPDRAGVPYDLTMPLFSDYADKHRVLYLPPNTQAVYSADEVWDLPPGTIIAKTFSFRDTSAEPAVDQLVETRLLIHREHGWVGLPYIWNEDASEAVLSPQGGFRTVSVTAPSGETLTTLYEIPSRTDCGGCHFDDANRGGGAVPIGPKTRLLNRTYAYDGASWNQIVRLAHLGKLAGAPGNPELEPRLPGLEDPGGSLEARARGYLESNCAHCHNPDGRAGFTGFWLAHDAPLDVTLGLCKRPVAAGSGALGSWVLVPGDPADSILVNRMKSVAPATKMPELSKSLVHTEGVALVEAWIASLPGSCP